jgi:hypothetical protein
LGKVDNLQDVIESLGFMLPIFADQCASTGHETKLNWIELIRLVRFSSTERELIDSTF